MDYLCDFTENKNDLNIIYQRNLSKLHSLKGPSTNQIVENYLQKVKEF
jgi:hypothetical protein